MSHQPSAITQVVQSISPLLSSAGTKLLQFNCKGETLNLLLEITEESNAAKIALIAWNNEQKLKEASISIIKFYRKLPGEATPACFSIVDLSQTPKHIEDPQFEELSKPNVVKTVEVTALVKRPQSASSNAELGLKERARLGDTNAIKQILDMGLVHKNATTVVRLHQQLLKIQVQSTKLLDQQTVVLAIQRQLDLLKSEVFDSAEITGCINGAEILWTEKVLFIRPKIKRIKTTSSRNKILNQIHDFTQNLSLQQITIGSIVLILGIGWFLNTRTTVPDVVGEQIAYAEGILKGKDLDVKIIEQVEDNIQPGQIITQNPEPSSFFPKGEVVELTVAKAPSYTLQGSLTLYDSDIEGSSSDCYGSGGYDDIGAYMPVTVQDGSGNILATGKTEKGNATDSYRTIVIACTFDFIIEVPKSEFYSIIINSGKRGQLNYSLQEMESKNWIVSLSIGL
jgi:hypothetical protein